MTDHKHCQLLAIPLAYSRASPRTITSLENCDAPPLWTVTSGSTLAVVKVLPAPFEIQCRL